MVKLKSTQNIKLQSITSKTMKKIFTIVRTLIKWFAITVFFTTGTILMLIAFMATICGDGDMGIFELMFNN